MKSRLVLFVLMAVHFCPLQAEEVDHEMMMRIRHEGLKNSQVMETMSYLTDVHGPRLSNSPGLKAASEWSRDKLTEWGLTNAALEPWGEFGRGWSLERFSIHMTEPSFSPIIAYPKAWTAGTGGKVSGQPVLLDISSEEDLDEYKGKLNGAIVLMAGTREAQTHFEADARRRDEESLKELAMAPDPAGRSGFAGRRAEFRRLRQLRRKVAEFLKKEGAAVVLEASRGEHGTLFVGGGGSRDPKDEPAIPQLVVSIEHHARIARLLEKKVPVNLEVEIATQFHEEDLQGYNVVADISGTDPRIGSELVMLGGHIDSWHAATGATDNAAGVAVAMEAVRILRALNVEPRRTIRVGFWSGEEQGLLGSRGYVEKHFAVRKTMELKPDHDKFSAYFNLDNGTGKIRGVYLQENSAVRPIFEAWLEPFQDLGAETLSVRNTGGTDHLAFDAVGLPGFQFIQDPIDYSTRTHHTNMDFWDHAIAGDLMQASVIMAAFVYNAAMRDEKLPRKPLPLPEEPAEGQAPPAVTSGANAGRQSRP